MCTFCIPNINIICFLNQKICECIGYWLEILLGRALEMILRSAAEKSSREINSSTFSSSVGNHSQGRDTYSGNEEEDGDDDEVQGRAFLRDEDREKFLIFEVRA